MVRTADPLVESLTLLLGEDKSGQFDSLPSDFTAELPPATQKAIEDALLKGLKEEQHHPVLLKVMEELGARKYDLNRPIYDLNRYELIFYEPKKFHNMFKGNLIHLACAEMKWELVLEMLKIKGVDVNAISTDKETFLMSAAQQGVTKIIQELLLNPGIDPNMDNSYNDTAFSLACCSGQFEVVKILLSDPRVDPEDFSFYSACYKGNLKVVELLLSDSRIDPNESNQREETALFEACDHNKVSSSRRTIKSLYSIV